MSPGVSRQVVFAMIFRRTADLMADELEILWFLVYELMPAEIFGVPEGASAIFMAAFVSPFYRWIMVPTMFSGILLAFWISCTHYG